MISALSAYKAMMQAPADEKPAKRVDSLNALASLSEPMNEVDGSASPDGDVVNISGSQDVFTAVESFFNQGKSNRFEDFHNLSREDKETFVKVVAELAKSGYMGYEELIVDNKIERHDLTTQIADDRIRGAKAYDSAKDPSR